MAEKFNPWNEIIAHLDDKVDCLLPHEVLELGAVTLGKKPSQFLESLLDPALETQLQNLCRIKSLDYDDFISAGNVMCAQIKNTAECSVQFLDNPSVEKRLELAESNLKLGALAVSLSRDIPYQKISQAPPLTAELIERH